MLQYFVLCTAFMSMETFALADDTAMNDVLPDLHSSIAIDAKCGSDFTSIDYWSTKDKSMLRIRFYYDHGAPVRMIGFIANANDNVLPAKAHWDYKGNGFGPAASTVNSQKGLDFFNRMKDIADPFRSRICLGSHTSRDVIFNELAKRRTSYDVVPFPPESDPR